MRSSPIYNFTQRYLAPGDYKKYQAKMSTITGKSYFLHPVSVSSPSLSIKNSQYQIIDQHISIYSEYQDNIPGLEAYHLTVRAMQGEREFTIHCYFNLNGDMRETTLKQGDTFIELSETDIRTLKTYGIQVAENLVDTLGQYLLKKQNELRSAIQDKENHAESLSRNLRNNLKQYIVVLRELIDLMDEFNFISNQSLANQRHLLEKMLSACESRVPPSKKSRKSLAKKPDPDPEKASDSSTTNLESKLSKVNEEIQKNEPSRLTLDVVIQKLNELKGTDLDTLQERKKLLEIRLQLTPSSDFENIITVLQSLNRLANEIPKRTLSLALEGNTEAARAIIANNYFVSFDFYFKLVWYGQEEVFDILFNATPFRTVLIKSQLMTSHPEDISSTRDFPANFLAIAYRQRREAFFKKLLFTYRSPTDDVSPSGKRLMHIIAQDGSIDYAQWMFDAGADLNIRVEPAKGHMWMGTGQQGVQLDRRKFQENAQHIESKVLPGLKAHEMTPLMSAAYHSQDRMVRWLVDHKADVTIRGHLGLDAIGIHTSEKSKTLHPPTILALLEAGMSIDSINAISTMEQCNPLHYACQYLDVGAVRLLVTQFAANPNVMVKKSMGVNAPCILMDCLSLVLYKTSLRETREHAVEIMHFLLNQDIRPIIESAFVSCHAVARQIDPKFRTMTTPASIMRYQAAHVALEACQYINYRDIMQEEIVTVPSPIGQVILKSHLKFSLIKAAEDDLYEKNYRGCLAACSVILQTEFNTEQYSERLWGAYYKAYLALKDYENARKGLEQYIAILNRKASQVLAPKYKAETQKKLADANALMREIREKQQSLEIKRAAPVAALTTVQSASFFVDPAELAIIKRRELASTIRRRRDDSWCDGGAFGYRHK